MDETVQAQTAPALELDNNEKQLILEALNLLVKSTDNALIAAQKVLPIAGKISQTMAKQG